MMLATAAAALLLVVEQQRINQKRFEERQTRRSMPTSYHRHDPMDPMSNRLFQHQQMPFFNESRPNSAKKTNLERRPRQQQQQQQLLPLIPVTSIRKRRKTHQSSRYFHNGQVFHLYPETNLEMRPQQQLHLLNQQQRLPLTILVMMNIWRKIHQSSRHFHNGRVFHLYPETNLEMRPQQQLRLLNQQQRLPLIILVMMNIWKKIHQSSRYFHNGRVFHLYPETINIEMRPPQLRLLNQQRLPLIPA
mmetsp:Transcript_20586/g.50533  ORF Transcript_20586/g.50533 Transcript_20586/m.50533 type:complete len:247 (+) Transcript_20586:1663-2403(+)